MSRWLAVALSLLLCGVVLPVSAEDVQRHTLIQEDLGIVHPFEVEGCEPVYTQTNLSCVITSLGSAVRTLLLPVGDWTISSNLTIPANISLYVPSGSTISVGSGATLTINGSFRCDANEDCLSLGAGSYVFGPNSIGLRPTAANALEIIVGGQPRLTIQNAGRIDLASYLNAVPMTFAALSGLTPADGDMGVCSNCGLTSNSDNTCSGAGDGAFFVRLAGAWRCFSTQDTESGVSGGGTPDDNSVTSAKIVDGAIMNADINVSAAIDLSKLATNPLARANHTGTQTASTVSNFDTQVRTSRLDQMATPTNAVPMGAQNLTGLPAPAGADHAATKAYVDAHIDDTSDAHDASEIKFTPTGSIAAANVQAAIAEVAAEAAGGVGIPGGADTQCQYNDGGVLGGDPGCTYNETTNVLTLTGGFIGPLTGNVTGNASTATALAANGTNCGPGLATPGMNTVGASEDCFDVATQGELNAHVNNPTDAHDASAISTTTFGTISSANAQSAMEEIHTEASTVTSAEITDGEIVNADINAAAAIALSKLAIDPLARANHTGTQTASTVSDFDTQVRTSRLDQMSTPTADVQLGSRKITGLDEPINATDAATKAYVDAVAQGLDVKAAVDVATTANITLSGEQVVDTVTTLVTRILVKNQTNLTQNGLYVTAAGAWARADDANTPAEVHSGIFTLVLLGTQALSGWALQQTAVEPVVLGTTDLVFAQFNGAGAPAIGGAGILKTGNTLDIVAADGTITVNADSIKVATGGITGTEIAAAIKDPAAATAGLRTLGTGAAQATAGNDARLSNQRTPSDNSVTSTKITDGAILNADINTSAAIALSKLATDPLARANHTGSQTAATISNFDTQVRTSRLDQMATPTAPVAMGTQNMTGLLVPSASDHAATKGYVDTHIDDTTAAHAASAIVFTTDGSIAAATVQAAIAEVRTEAAPTLSDVAPAAGDACPVGVGDRWFNTSVLPAVEYVALDCTVAAEVWQATGSDVASNLVTYDPDTNLINSPAEVPLSEILEFEPVQGTCQHTRHSMHLLTSSGEVRTWQCPDGSGSNPIESMGRPAVRSVCVGEDCLHCGDNDPNCQLDIVAGPGLSCALTGTAPVMVVTCQSGSSTVQMCGAFDAVGAGLDNKILGAPDFAWTVEEVWCNYEGAAPTTVAQFQLEDGSNAVMTHTPPTCASAASAATKQAVTNNAASQLVARQALRFDTTNTPNPASDSYLICAKGVTN